MMAYWKGRRSANKQERRWYNFQVSLLLWFQKSCVAVPAEVASNSETALQAPQSRSGSEIGGSYHRTEALM